MERGKSVWRARVLDRYDDEDGMSESAEIGRAVKGPGHTVAGRVERAQDDTMCRGEKFCAGSF